MIHHVVVRCIAHPVRHSHHPSLDVMRFCLPNTIQFNIQVGPTEDDFVICREGYVSAEGVLKHLENVGDVLNQALQFADIVDLMVQGPAEELEKLKEPLADFSPDYYPLVAGSLRSKKIR